MYKSKKNIPATGYTYSYYETFEVQKEVGDEVIGERIAYDLSDNELKYPEKTIIKMTKSTLNMLFEMKNA